MPLYLRNEFLLVRQGIDGDRYLQQVLSFLE